MAYRRRNWPAHVPAGLAGAGTVFVAATAFVLAYGGSKGAALDAGISPAAAGWYPLCIEGALVVASVSTVILRGKDRAFAWIVLLLFVAVSTAANVLHSLDHGAGHWWSPYAAAVPPLSLPICTWLAERVALSTLHAPLTADGRAATAPVGPDSAGPVTPPGRASGDHVDTAAGPSSTPPPSNSLPAAVDSGRPDVRPGVRSPAPEPQRSWFRRSDVPDAPEGSVAGVYRLFSESDVLLYVGCSKDIKDRVSGLQGYHWWIDVDRIEVKWFDDVDAAADAELDAIRTESPLHNRGPFRYRPHASAPANGKPQRRPRPRKSSRPKPDWRTSDWSAVAQARGIERSQAFKVIKLEGDAAVQAARQQLAAASAPLNGSAP